VDTNAAPNNIRFADVESLIERPIDTLLLDCEGCVQHMMGELGPPIRRGQIRLILLEADMPKGVRSDCQSDCMDYDIFFDFLEHHGYVRVDMFNDCNTTRLGTQDWCGPWIWHYAFQLKQKTSVEHGDTSIDSITTEVR